MFFGHLNREVLENTSTTGKIAAREAESDRWIAVTGGLVNHKHD